MNQKKIDKNKEEVYNILINSKNKKEFVSALGYKDARQAPKICERFNLNLEDLGKNRGGYYGKPIVENEIFGMLTVIKPNCDKINNETASLCRCDCGQEILVKNDFLKRNHTTSCGCKKGHDENNKIKDNQQFGDLIVLKANYKTNKHSDAVSLCQCKCGKVFDVINNCLRRGQVSCGCSTMSKMERKVAELLKEANIPFQQEVSFSDLKSLKGNLLRFDFVVYDKEGRIVCAIETDGEQHFYQVRRFQKTICDFRQTQEWDRRKNDYCIRKNIPLIRIPYWDADKLTLDNIFKNQAYRVTNKFHNDLLNRR